MSAWQASDSSWRKNHQPAAITSRRMDRADAGLVTPVGLRPCLRHEPAKRSHPDRRAPVLSRTSLRSQADRKNSTPRAQGGTRPAERGRWERVVSKNKFLVSGSDPQFSETHRGTHPYFFGTIGLGNRKGTNAMIRSDRFIAGIAIVGIIASLGYIAWTLIG
jgi:predicted nucleic acid-binding Zn ribbon protein